MRAFTRVAALVLGSSLVLAAQQPGNTGWTPVFQIRARSSTPQGTRIGVAGEWKIVKDGEPLGMTFFASPTLCALGVGTSATDLPAEAGTARAVWVVTGSSLGEQDGRQQVRVTSKFLRLGGRESAASTTQTLSLRDGDEVTLDAISEPVDAACNVHTVTFEARLAMQPATAALAQTTYAADLWLIHDGPFNAEMREHQTVNVNGLASASFVFKPLTFSLPLIDSRQGDIRASISLSGSIRGRARADGMVDVDLETNRLVYGITSPESVPPLTSLLRKTVTIKPGETTAVDFPPPSGGSASVQLEAVPGAAEVRLGSGGAGLNTPAQQGLQVIHGRLVLNTGEFFKGHKTQMLITLKPLR